MSPTERGGVPSFIGGFNERCASPLTAEHDHGLSLFAVADPAKRRGSDWGNENFNPNSDDEVSNSSKNNIGSCIGDEASHTLKKNAGIQAQGLGVLEQ